MKTTPLALLGAASLLLQGACAQDFAPYREVRGLRLLAVSADDPWLAPNQETTLRALVVAPEGSEVNYSWSWCPLTRGSDTGYLCALTRDEIQAQIDEIAGPGLLTVPPYELGTEATATYRYALPPQFFQAACEALRQANIPGLPNLPRCGQTFPINIRLEIQSGDTTITAVKDVELVFEPTELNTNPRLRGLVAYAAATPQVSIPVNEDGSARLSRGEAYRLELEIDPEEAQPFLFTPPDGSPPVTRREQLVFTWFVEAGELKFTRTSFIEGEITFDAARENTFTPPNVPDYPERTLRLWIVARDGRRGLSWIERSVTLED